MKVSEEPGIGLRLKTCAKALSMLMFQKIPEEKFINDYDAIFVGKTGLPG